MINQDEARDVLIIPGRIPPKEICFINSLIDDHDGLAVMRTEDAVEGRMEFWVAPHSYDDFIAFVEYIRAAYQITFEIYDPIPHTTELDFCPE
jgi:hypothetical protein